MEYSLHDFHGRRKYLVAEERDSFLRKALEIGGTTATFCAVLALSGARVSEVLALTPERLDEAAGTINFETLKRRKRGLIRAVPVPNNLFDLLDAVHRFRGAQNIPTSAGIQLWDWSRTTAWRRVQHVMHAAQNPSHLSNPRSLRHAFGAQAALSQIPLTMIRKWMGHARLETTEIYTGLVGDQERQLARLTWGDLDGYRSS
jgi:integrase